MGLARYSWTRTVGKALLVAGPDLVMVFLPLVVFLVALALSAAYLGLPGVAASLG